MKTKLYAIQLITYFKQVHWRLGHEKTGRKWNRIDSFLSNSVKLMIPLTRRIFKNFHEFSLDRERSPNPNTTPSLLKNSLKVFTDELLPLKLHQDMSFSPLIPVSRYLDKAVPP